MPNKPSNINYELTIIADQLSKKLDNISTDEIIKKLIDENKFYMKKNKIGITIRDALVIYNWLFYAQKIKDENVKKLSKKIPYSSFIDKKFL